MALDTYANLKTFVCNAMERPDDVALATDWVTLGEARLNRELGAAETDATLTGVVDNRRIDISSLSIAKPIALFMAETGCDEVLIAPKADGTFPYLTSSSRPTKWAIDGTNIDFDCPLDGAYPFRLRYRQRFALSDSVTTNWLLTNHPDVYVAATIVWGHAYKEDFGTAGTWKSVLDEQVPEIRNYIAQSKRATLSVDPGLRVIGTPSYSQLVNGSF